MRWYGWHTLALPSTATLQFDLETVELLSKNLSPLCCPTSHVEEACLTTRTTRFWAKAIITTCIATTKNSAKASGARRQRELVEMIAHGEILSAEDDVDLSGVSVPQEINELSTMPIITIEEHLAFPSEDDRG